MNVKVVERKDFLRYLLLMNETQKPSVFANRFTRLSTLMGMLFLLCFSSHTYGQDDLNLHGVISDAMSSSKIEGVKVTVKKDGAQYESYTTRANGKYEFYLDCGATYELVFQKDGYVDRSIIVDSKNVPEEVVGAGIIMPTDMSMYEITPAMENMDMSVFKQPIGKASYNPEDQDLSWDFGHTTKVKAEIFAFIREVEKRQKELDKENSAENKAAEALEEKFNEFVEAGDDAMSKKKYQDAVLNYQAAIELKDDAAVKAKLGDAETKYNAQMAAQKLEEEFSAALDAGDGFMRTEEYDKAIEQYEAALVLKPGESYPTEQIALAQKALEEQAANMANQEKFNQLISDGDGLVADEKFEEALVPYKEAKALMPDNREVQRKIEETELAIKTLAEKAARQEEYDGLVATADAAFKAEDYEAAKDAYGQASAVFADEAYPQDQIVICEAKINELANAAEMQAKYDKAMADGEAAMASENYTGAISSFEEALTAKSGDPAATAKIEEANGLIAELEAEANKQANYDAAIAEADELLGSENYAEAKTKYQAAKEIIPEEMYPTKQISKIDKIIAENAELAAIEEAYTAAMAAGDAAMESVNYAEAIAQYQAALEVKAEDKDATKKLEEATALKQEQDANAELNESYQALIDAADQKFANQELEGAQADYQAALELKNENYPSDQLALIETMNAEMAAEAEAAAKAEELQAAYDAHMKSGDESLMAKRYDDAITSFTAALNVIPDDPIASAKLEEANAIKQSMMDAAALDELYESKIAIADELFEAKDWDAATNAYQAALDIKQDEKYPVEQIEKIQAEKAAMAEAEMAALQAEKTAKIAALVAEGDAALAEDGFQTAVDKYEEAYDLDRDRADIQAKIDVANEKLLAYLENQANREAFDAAIAEGDKQFEEANWARAKSSFEDALEIYANEAYPQSKIELIDIQLALLAEQEAAELEAALMAEFNEYIEAGDKRFNKKKYEKALEEYEAALSLIPDNELAKEKIAAVNDILMKTAEDEANQNAYAAAIEEADGLFKSDDLEMAKMKYADAQEIMPSQTYPSNKITEIDLLLEKRRLAELANDAAALEAEYQAALRAADAFLNEKNYIQAIDGYESALEIKADEQYPLSQLERIELLMEDEAAEAAERARLAELEAEKAARAEARNSKQNSVNTNSEEQAEQFMREAREAQEREKYERLKAEKDALNQRLYSYEQQSRAQRMSVELSYEYYAISDEERYSAAVKSKQDQTASSVDYKKTLLRNQEKQSELGKVKTDYAYAEIEKVAESRESQMRESVAEHKTKRKEARVESEEQLAKVEQLSSSSVDDRMAYNDAMQAMAAELYAQNKRAEELRNERAKELVEMGKDREEYQRSLSERNIDDIRAKSEQQRANLQAYEEDSEARSKDKINANARALDQQKNSYNSSMTDTKQRADAQRSKNAQEMQNTNQGKEKAYDDYFRSQLANNYPQGVTEESSTLGNKVIITRIVVRGNRGDEYKKVVDKAGNYYFKNGRSISENTWDRETIRAFNKSKD